MHPTPSDSSRARSWHPNHSWHPSRWRFLFSSEASLSAEASAASRVSVERAVPAARIAAPTPPVPASCSRAEVTARGVTASAAEVIGARTLSRGATRLFETLFRLGVDTVRARGYRAVPSSLLFHCPALLIAFQVGYTDRHVRSLCRELEAAGLLDAGGHAQRVHGQSWYDGTLWCVKLRPEAPAPRIRPEEWTHGWRPDFARDVELRRGAARLISELRTQQASEEKIYYVVLGVVTNSNYDPPVEDSSEIHSGSQLRTVQDVAQRLSGLLNLPSSRRSALIGRLGEALGRALNDLHSRRWYCKVIWQAYQASVEGRGGLQMLAALLERLQADLREFAGLRCPGAWLAARMRA